MYKPAPYCAEFQVAYLDLETNEIDISPRRPLGELYAGCMRECRDHVRASGAVALYSMWDADLYKWREWLEGKWALGCDVTIKKRPSRQYKKLWDALYAPCQGHRRYPVAMESKWTLVKESGGIRLESIALVAVPLPPADVPAFWHVRQGVGRVGGVVRR